MRIFNAGFFKLVMGFLGMVTVSFVFLIGLAYYEKAIESSKTENLGNVTNTTR